MIRIEQLLRREIGLDAASIGSSAIERIVRLRMKSLGLKNHDDYLRVLETARTKTNSQVRNEWEELVESVIVAETWFFRDRPTSPELRRSGDPFAALVELVQNEWLPQHPTSVFRLLSLPCSSGEEPYSLAMALLDADIPAERFTIDAVDISARALARAQRATYGKNSFRGKNLDFRDRYFHATPDGHVLHPRVRKCVEFHRANILADDFFSGSAPYDFIFCRNLLIYFDRDTQAKSLAKLHRLLAPPILPPGGCRCSASDQNDDGPCVRCGGSKGGVLFVGAAELPLATAEGFISANLPMAFACRRAIQTSNRGTTQTSRVRPSRLGGLETRRIVTPKPPPPKSKAELNSRISISAHPARPVSSTSSSDLASARNLADAGKLTEAAAICKAHLDRQGPSAQAFYLLGLVHDASSEPALTDQAMDYYRKALYLEPDHYETLLQMSLLSEKNGDRAAALTFKRRAEKAKIALKVEKNN